MHCIAGEMALQALVGKESDDAPAGFRAGFRLIRATATPLQRANREVGFIMKFTLLMTTLLLALGNPTESGRSNVATNETSVGAPVTRAAAPESATPIPLAEYDLDTRDEFADDSAAECAPSGTIVSLTCRQRAILVLTALGVTITLGLFCVAYRIAAWLALDRR